jgi:hypothetical protein
MNFATKAILLMYTRMGDKLMGDNTARFKKIKEGKKNEN